MSKSLRFRELGALVAAGLAPGRVLTLYISGTKTVLPSANRGLRATGTPLPTVLGGFSVSVRQGGNTYPAPLFSVVQTPDCTDAGQTSPDCITAALTLQVPFDLAGVATQGN